MLPAAALAQGIRPPALPPATSPPKLDEPSPPTTPQAIPAQRPVVAIPPVRTLGDDDVLSSPVALDPSTPEGQVLEIRRTLLRGEYDRAETLATAWLDRNDPHPFRAEVLLARGDAKRALGDEYKALYDYEAIATLYSGSEVYITALEREFEIAKEYAAGKRRKFLGVRLFSGDAEAEELFIRIQERLPASQLAEEAGMALGDFYMDRGEMQMAAEAYQLFLENYPRSPQVRKARIRLISARLATFKGAKFDASGLDEAKLLLLGLEEIEPLTAQQIGAESLLLGIDERKALKLLEEGRWYARVRDPVAAELSVRRLIERYPRTVAAIDGLDFAVELLPRLPAWVRETCPDYEGLRTGAVAMPPPRSQRTGAPVTRSPTGAVRPGSTTGVTVPDESPRTAEPAKQGIRDRLKDAGAAEREANQGGVKSPLLGGETPVPGATKTTGGP